MDTFEHMQQLDLTQINQLKVGNFACLYRKGYKIQAHGYSILLVNFPLEILYRSENTMTTNFMGRRSNAKRLSYSLGKKDIPL